MVEEVNKQDELAQGLLTTMLNIMKSIQEKAPVRKKEDRQELREAEKKFHGQKPACMESTVLRNAEKEAGNAPGTNVSPQPTWDGRGWSAPN
eukprot:1027323-Heterocapsa_arctica.AAC.1